MTPAHIFVVDDAVMEFFAERNKREREELLKIFRSLAESPNQNGEWRQKTKFTDIHFQTRFCRMILSMQSSKNFFALSRWGFEFFGYSPALLAS